MAEIAVTVTRLVWQDDLFRRVLGDGRINFALIIDSWSGDPWQYQSTRVWMRPRP